MVDYGLSLFAVEGTREYGERVARHLDLVLGSHEERAFEDGEHKIRPLVEVRRQDVFVIHSLHGDAEQTPNDKLCRLLFFIAHSRTPVPNGWQRWSPIFAMPAKTGARKPAIRSPPNTWRDYSRLAERTR
jgi:ribose-phosphate pyrophosphokinase